MTNNILALIDASAETDEPTIEAIRLAAESGAPLILGIDPRDEPFQILTARISHWLDLGASAGVPISTMLVNICNTDAIARTARAHNVDLVVLGERQADGLTAPDVSRALKAANICFVLVPGPARTLVGA